MEEDIGSKPDYKLLEVAALEAYPKIASVKAVFISDSNTVVTLVENPSREDRCLIYDAERLLSKTHPDLHFGFFVTESAAKYGEYHVIYQRAE